jgi:hypothetical protein
MDRKACEIGREMLLVHSHRSKRMGFECCNGSLRFGAMLMTLALSPLKTLAQSRKIGLPNNHIDLSTNLSYNYRVPKLPVASRTDFG